LFLAAPFTAAFFYDFTGGFDLKFLRRALSNLVRNKLAAGDGGKAAIVVILLCVMGWTASQERYAFRSREDDRDLFAVTHYLNTATSPAALIETYDSELFLFLNRAYTYAPPRILVEVFSHELDRTRTVTYDPLAARPDYIVVGDFGRWAGFYKPLIEQNHVRLVKTIGRYQVYEPVRP
jgi:hypothetical protein